MAHQSKDASTTGGIPVSLSMNEAVSSTLGTLTTPDGNNVLDRRVVWISALAIAIGAASALVAEFLMRLIGLITNVCFAHSFAVPKSVPIAGEIVGQLGWLHRWWVVIPPVVGGIVVGLMARFGSKAIRGDGLPEAIDQVLHNQSKIPPKMTFLKPLSAAITIGTGGPFGAEGPIIATGSALGSLIGQIFEMSADERKILLAAGAAAGMSAMFLGPVSSVLLAIELLLFEYRARSLVPVALASAVACAVRMGFIGTAPIFPMPLIDTSSGSAFAAYIVIGAIIGLAGVGVTRAVYWAEDRVEHSKIHWMWWPALGSVVVGLCGVLVPHTLGPGYDNITGILDGQLIGPMLAVLLVFKFISWVAALASGNSGGTLSPLFTFGGAIGALCGVVGDWLLPSWHIDPRIAGLVGMAAMFAGTTRMLLASIVFAFETTHQTLGLLPLLGGCAAAYLISALLMENTINTEKLARHGARVVTDYAADYLDGVLVRDVCSSNVIALHSEDSIEEVRRWLDGPDYNAHHQGFPVVDAEDRLVGVVTRRDLLDSATDPRKLVREVIKREVAVVYDSSSLREAADHMVNNNVGRLPVVRADAPRTVVGILTRSDLLAAHRNRLRQAQKIELTIPLRPLSLLNRRSSTAEVAAIETVADSDESESGQA